MTSSTSSPPAESAGLQLKGITKTFGSFVANDAIDLDVRPGEIHCLLGENGAGKSTLMNVLYGLYQPDGGQIVIDGTPRQFADPKQAMAAGIGMVHQHFMLVEVFSVAENLILGREPGLVVDMKTARATVRELSARYGLPVDPDAVIEDLPVGIQQRVEILKALANDAKYLIFDEPTAVLTPQEIDELMGVMQALRDEGKAIVFITHKLREVRAIADKITVIRRGKVVGTALPSESNEELAAKMVGRAVDLDVDKEAPKLGDTTFVVSELTVFDEVGAKQVDELSFEVREGEILVIAGVQGNGQTELTEAILGLHKKALGSITLDGNELIGQSVKKTLDAGLGFVPEDRTEDGIVGDFTIAENLVLDRADRQPFSNGIALKLREITAFAEKNVKDFDVRAPSIETAVGRLSGGNQQKVVLARELGRDLRMFIASQPTRGLDVGSIEFVHEQIVRVRDSGIPVIIVSTELDEVVQLADRIMVMYQGKSMGIVGPDTSRDVLGQMMAGVEV